MDNDIVVIETVSGMLQAEILRALFESEGIPVWLSHESAGTAMGLGIGPLADVEIIVPNSFENTARQLLQDYYSGDIESSDQG
jgi:hypothetical protein